MRLLFVNSTTQSSLLSSTKLPRFEPIIQCLVNESMSKLAPFMAEDTNIGQEWAIMVLICGNPEKLIGNVSLDGEKFSKALDVRIHVSSYLPMVFGDNRVHLVLVGRGRCQAFRSG